MNYFKKIFKESIIVVIISSLMGLISGSVLSINEDMLYAIPILLLILPALNSLIGDISTVLVSRLTTHLYIGTLSPNIRPAKRLSEDFFGLFITLLLSLVFLVILGFTIGLLSGVNIVNPFMIILIICLTVIIIFLAMFILSFVSSIFLFKRGMDPNNFLIPLITSLADFLTPFTLILFIIIFI
ncbi:MAG: magnesium transporter [Promethearchaeota archaeon]|jgi:mgtE-like transporter